MLSIELKRTWMKSIRAVVLYVLMALFMSAFSYAQQRQLVIRDGSVFIDGRKVAEDNLPASLSLDGLDVMYSFRGIPNPTFTINGTSYQLSGHALVDLNAPHRAPQREHVSVIFRDGTELPEAYRPPTLDAPRPTEATSTRGEDLETLAQVRQYIETLQLQAEALHRISAGESLPRAEDLVAFTNEMRLQAQQAARLASDLPKIEVQSYLQDVQQQDVELYGQLVREWELEAQTFTLAQEIRNMKPGSMREQRMEKLRHLLHKIFELKQDNRRREIEQLEKRLSDLQQGLAKREQMRDRIIDKRLKELVQH